MKKFLIIRFSSIGDIVLTTPVVRCLREQTGAEVHYLTKRKFAPLLEANPHISKVHAIDQYLAEVIPRLRAEHFDAVVDLHKNWRSFGVRMSLGKMAYSFDKLNLQKWLLVQLKWDLLPKVSIVQRYMQAVEPLGVKDDGGGLEYYLPEQREALSVVLPEKYIAVAIGAAHNTKRLPMAVALDLCLRLTLPAVLLGGVAEWETGQAIASALPEGRAINLCGKSSLHQSAAVIRDAAAVLSHDTGMMHIAAAFRKPIVSVWGSTVPAFGMLPYYGTRAVRNLIFELKDLPCRPCSKIGYEKCPNGHFRCMNDQPTIEIASAVNQLCCPSPGGNIHGATIV